MSVDKIDHERLARECNKLDLALEQQLAEEGLEENSESWPEF